MRLRTSFSSLLLLASAVMASSCGDDPVITESPCCAAGAPALRIVNAYTTSVDVLVDGAVVVAGLAAGAIDTAALASGAHTVLLRPTSGSGSSTHSITAGSAGLSTVAVVRASNGSVGGAMLDDTNSVVAAGATKVRVLHLATNAGTLQVFRTQPDYQTPISWQFPFDYQPQPTSVSAPFYQSTPGTWEIRVWQAPTDGSGWTTAPLRIAIPLASGEKRTVLLLDKPGGGVRAELL